jgi:chaperone required for assembly of F1-ATPase
MAPVPHQNRVYITLKPSTLAAFTRLAQALRKPKATVISQMIEENSDAIDQLAHAVEVAREAEEFATNKWRSDMTKAAEVSERLLQQAHALISDVSEKAADGRATRPKAHSVSASVRGRP